MTVTELAYQSLAVLNLQRNLLHTRKQSALNELRDAERRLRATCEAVLNPAAPGLFDRDPPKPEVKRDIAGNPSEELL